MWKLQLKRSDDMIKCPLFFRVAPDQSVKFLIHFLSLADLFSSWSYCSFQGSGLGSKRFKDVKKCPQVFYDSLGEVATQTYKTVCA